MLDTLRKGAGSLPAKILLGLLTLSFIGWGVGSRLGASHSDTLATVGGTKVSVGDFQLAYQRQSQEFSRRLGQPLTPDIARAFGLPQQVLGSLMAKATIDDEAASLGLGVSDARLAQMIADDANLRPPSATSFDRSYFVQLLRQNGITEATYIRERRGDEIERQLVEGLTGDVRPSKTMVEAVYAFRNEQRHVDYVTLSRATVEPIADPSDDVLSKWFEDHKSEFKAPEYRTIRFIKVTPETATDPASVSDADARREYDRTKSQYVTPETRRVQQLLFPSLDEAKAAEAKLKGGESFDDLIAERGAKPEDVDLGVVTRDKLGDQAVADAAFALADGAVSEPVQSAFGTVLLRVTQIVPGETQPFEAVAAEIKKALATKFAERTVLDSHDEIEDALAGGATLDEVATRFKLPLTTIVSDASGKDESGKAIDGLPDGGKLLPAAFATDEGVQNDPVQAEHGFVWYDVAKIAPGRDRGLDEVKAEATAAWKNEEANRLLDAKAKTMVDALKGGAKIEDVAKTDGLSVASADVTRQSDNADLGAKGLDAAFGGPVGHAEAVRGDGDDRVVVRVAGIDDVKMPEGAGEALTIADQLSGNLQAGLFSQYVAAAQETFGTTINQSLLNAVVGSDTN